MFRALIELLLAVSMIGLAIGAAALLWRIVFG
jgi:hypothetical protein